MPNGMGARAWTRPMKPPQFEMAADYEAWIMEASDPETKLSAGSSYIQQIKNPSEEITLTEVSDADSTVGRAAVAVVLGVLEALPPYSTVKINTRNQWIRVKLGLLSVGDFNGVLINSNGDSVAHPEIWNRMFRVIILRELKVVVPKLDKDNKRNKDIFESLKTKNKDKMKEKALELGRW